MFNLALEIKSDMVHRPFFYSEQKHCVDIKSRNVATGTLNFADMEGWNVAESKGWKVADTIFLRDGKLPTLLFQGLESCRKTLKD